MPPQEEVLAPMAQGKNGAVSPFFSLHSEGKVSCRLTGSPYVIIRASDDIDSSAVESRFTMKCDLYSSRFFFSFLRGEWVFREEDVVKIKDTGYDMAILILRKGSTNLSNFHLLTCVNSYKNGAVLLK